MVGQRILFRINHCVTIRILIASRCQITDSDAEGALVLPTVRLPLEVADWHACTERLTRLLHLRQITYLLVGEAFIVVDLAQRLGFLRHEVET